MTATATVIDQALADEAARLRADQALGKSETLARLFDFLLVETLAGRKPKEVEVAREVFGKTAGFDAVLDASVRVYAHRLRKKLDDHYAAYGPPEAGRLYLPRGEYRLALATAAPPPNPAPDSAVAPAAPPAPPRAPRFRLAAAGLALLALTLTLAVTAILIFRVGHGDEITSSVLWRPLATERPTLVVFGDYFIFGESDDGRDVNRLVREYAINSREEFDDFLMAHPDKMGRYVPLGLTYAPTGAVSAIGQLMPVLARGAAFKVVAMSTLTPDMLRASNIVYVGYLSGLGALSDEVFGASRLRIGDGYDELIDKRTGRRFRADWNVTGAGGSPRRDYAYVATMPGPNGNRLTIVAGTRDAAVMQAAEFAIDPAQLRRIDAAAGGGRDVEALYQVDSMTNHNLGGALIFAAPVNARAMWQGARGQ